MNELSSIRTAHSDASSSTNWRSWGLRPIVLFVAAYTIVGILHELTHALTAYALHVPSVLFHVGVNVDRSQGTLKQHSVIGVSGPLFTLALGLLSVYLYRRAIGSRAGLIFLYLAMFGTGTFFGNLISTSFAGDFSRAALAFHLPMSIRYGVSVVGLLLLCGLSLLVGMELRRWTPLGVKAFTAMIGMVVLPAIVGTVTVVLIYLPMPFAFAVARLAESSFWIFGAVGAFVSRKGPTEDGRILTVGWVDFTILIVAVLLVRVMALGIPLAP